MADPNKRFLPIDQRSQPAWRLIDDAGMELTASMMLRRLPGEGDILAAADGGFSGLATPTALAVDGDGLVYVLDGEQILRFDPCVGFLEALPHLGGRGAAPRRLDRPTAIAISCQNDLYVSDSGNRRIQVFTLKGLVLRAVWGPYRAEQQDGRWRLLRTQAQQPAPCPPGEAGAPAAAVVTYPAGTWAPRDIALTPDGRAYVADYANGLIHLFDAQGCWRTSVDGVDDLGLALQKPLHLALDKAGNLYVVQEGRDYVVVLDKKGAFARRVSLPAEVAAEFAPPLITMDSAGRLYVCAGRSGHLFIYDDAQRTATRCPAFDGCGCALAVDGDDRPLLADRLSGKILRLESDASYSGQGYAIMGPLDSEIYRCEWHRVVLEGRVEPGTTVSVETFTADAPRSDAQIIALPPERWTTHQIWSRAGDGPWDCLVQSLPGRYLWLRLTLRGDGAHTAAVDGIRVHYPRASSLRFLPAVFREDPTSAAFLAQFLSIMDTIWDGIGQEIATIDRLFDPLATPAEFLPWLASWLDLTLERHWPEEKQRQLLAMAHELFALRGTAEGMRRLVALYTGVQPQILEHYRLRRWLYVNQGRLGDNTALWGASVTARLQLDIFSQIGAFQLKDSGDPTTDPFDTYAHQYTLYTPFPGAGETEKQTVRRIVDMAAPAHTKGRVQFVEPQMTIGRQSIVGVNTVIGRYPSGVVVEENRLGQGTVLSPSAAEAAPPTMQIGARARIGSSTLLD